VAQGASKRTSSRVRAAQGTGLLQGRGLLRRLRTWWRRCVPAAAFPLSLVFHFLLALTLMKVVWVNTVPDVKDVVLQIEFK